MTMIPKIQTRLGTLYEGDCMSMLSQIGSETVDLAFADPPFNLGKTYSSKINDALKEDEYIAWCREWLEEIIRTVKPGGAVFLWNLPKWNLQLGAYASQSLTFRHWITVDIKYSLPIQKRLYPSHYSLLYLIKGERPAIFHPDRLPVPCCRHCGGEQRDYGGYKHKMNPKGVSLTDVWTDIPPVRHAKYKKRDANALPLKLMDRIVSMASDPGSLVLDPFGGSGTTFVAAELNGRRWIGSELDCSDAIARFENLEPDRAHLSEIHANKNVLFTQAGLKARKKNGRPLSEKYRVEVSTHEGDTEECQCSSSTSAQGNLFS
jgi:site-specific DNA-methyltransferase (adenine-specific)